MPMPTRSAYSAAAALLLLCAAFLPAKAQDQNRVIIKDLKWRIYSTPHFDVHYYPAEAAWLPYVSGVLEAAYKRESADLNPSLSKRIDFFLFASLDDMEQNTIADVSDGVGGLTEPFKDRFMVWSDGSKWWLQDVIDHEFGHEEQFSILIDGFWKSARILKTYIYPLWMMEGMAEYETGMSDYAVEKLYVRDAVLNGKLIPLERLAQFGHLKPHQTTLAYKTGAQAIRFLADQYGRDKPRQMLELYRSRYDADSVLEPLIGSSLRTFDRNFREYLEFKYLAEQKDDRLQEPWYYGRRLTHGSGGIPEFNVSPAVSPDGRKVAYISTRDSQTPEVRVRDLVTGRETKLTYLSAGAENIPYGRFTKPLRSLAWSPDGKYIAFTGQKNHREYVFLYEPATGKVARAGVEGLDEIRQPAFTPDGKTLTVVGMSRSFNALYSLPLSGLLRGGELPASEARRLTEGQQDVDSPSWSPDGSKLAYSCEVDGSSAPVRALCLLRPGGKPLVVRFGENNIYDPVFTADGSGVYFVSDKDYDFELYLRNNSGEIYRLTRTMGGMFTPTVHGRRLYFSAFNAGGMDIYAADPEDLLYEEQPLPASGGGFEVTPSTGSFRPYRFKASTDLFYPALLFSSPGGLFWMNYWQASDMLGRHNLAFYLSYNSWNNYLDAQVSYAYTRWRMPLMLQSSVFTYDGLTDDDGFNYNKRYYENDVGTAWPFDRYNRVEAYLISKDEKDIYTDLGNTDALRTRALKTSYVRDTVDGLYLTAVRGSRTELSWQTAHDAAGGNLRYDVYTLQYLKYFPLSKWSAFVNRFTVGRSTGRDRRLFNFGGLGGLRGFPSSSALYEKSGVFMDNAELRVPLIKNLNYYMWYMFPDFYFKALYGKLFVDSAYGWNEPADLRAFGVSGIDASVGAGVDLHTFVLQNFQMVLSLDCAVRTSDGGKIFYFYLGPMF